MATRRLPKSPQPVQPAAQRVWGFARVSTDQQRDSGIGLDEQQRKIESRTREMGWTLEHVFVDAGVSGGTPTSLAIDTWRGGEARPFDPI